MIQSIGHRDGTAMDSQQTAPQLTLTTRLGVDAAEMRASQCITLTLTLTLTGLGVGTVVQHMEL